MFNAIERYSSLTVKEFRQLRRNKRLLIQLLIPPTVVLIVFGFALNPEVKNLQVGIVDLSRTPDSRSLLSALTEFEAFQIAAHYGSAGDAQSALSQGEVDFAIVIPPDFARRFDSGRTAQVQVLIDAVNANTAAISQGYLKQALGDYNRRLRPPATTRAVLIPLGGSQGKVAVLPELQVESVVLYNPGLEHSWFFVTGVMSVLLFLNGALVGSAVTVHEKERGTMEQLLMSPAQTLEMLMGKTTPIFVLLIGDLFIALLASWLVFDLPVRGSLLLLLLAGSFAALAGTGIGIALATFSANQQQGQLLTFFLIPPIVLISGAFAPIESMPAILRHLSVVDPLRYLLIVVRAITIKGAGIDLLWQPLLALAGFAVFLYGLSVWRFRKQLG